jgi:hypothetical protein
MRLKRLMLLASIEKEKKNLVMNQQPAPIRYKKDKCRCGMPKGVKSARCQGCNGRILGARSKGIKEKNFVYGNGVPLSTGDDPPSDMW